LGEPFVANELIVRFRANIAVPEKSLFDNEVFLTANPVLTQLRAKHGLIAVERLIPDELPRPKEGLTVERLPGFTGRPPTPEEIAVIFHHFGQDRTFLLRFSRTIDPPRMAEQLMRDYPAMIEYAEPNVLRQLDRQPNDPLFRQQWHLRPRPGDPALRFDVWAAEAWDINTGKPETVIAVLDTGVTLDHRDLTNKFLTGRSFITGFRTPTDNVGHGTAVSGTAAANTDNALDISGLCWDCQILPVKVCTVNGCPLSAIAQGINYAVTQASRGVRVINMSFGGPTRTSSDLSALQSANRAGILCVASAGNGGEDQIGDNNDEIPHYPSSFATELENVVAVAATDRMNRLSGFSNFGRVTVTLGAPGEGIWATVPTDSSLEINSPNGVLPLPGTSFSAPIVSGIGGLIYSQYPGITPAQVRARLEGSVDRFETLLNKLATGGRVNAFRALEQDDIAPDPITDLRLQTDKTLSATLAWTATGDDGQQGQAMFYEIRYSQNEITDENFDRASKVKIAPFPKTTGTAESWTIQDVSSGMFFFAIRAIDNVGNKSPISNPVMVQVN
jgi:subtilisin family serine protease